MADPVSTGVIAPATVDRALAAIDRVNAEDPVLVTLDGVARPKEVVHAERATHWLGVIDPDASVAQRLAARAHHLRRWVSPRRDYPEGRSGYLRWRTDQKRRQAAETATLLRDVGIEVATVDRVAAIVAKQRQATDPDVQTHEDVLCLVFLEIQLDDVAARLGDDHTVEVLRKTAAKMSERGLAATAHIEFSEHGRRLLETALADVATAE